MFKQDVYQPLSGLVKSFGGRPVYFTLDIDVADPAYANRTGTPEPGGITGRELLEAVRLFRDINLAGFDIVEVSPPYDSSGRTALLAAGIIREIVLMRSFGGYSECS